ncbi:MAG: hypothetical protein JXA00_06635, partial [Candidatus Thermoplasmatota archaeon]|nr:hypothetical protein [Candidatus Thermoplasmatota archaeon]
MKYKWILTGAVVIVVAIVLVSVFTGFFGSNFSLINRKPRVEMSYPSAGAVVFGIVMISGSASDPNAEDEILSVEIRVNEGNWIPVDGTTLWSYDWVTYEIGNGQYTIDARSSDGTDYSDLASVTVTVQNPTSVDSGSHQWAVLIAAANFPEKNETKLGNGGLYLAEDIVAYLVSSCGYPTSNVVVLFDDGW